LTTKFITIDYFFDNITVSLVSMRGISTKFFRPRPPHFSISVATFSPITN